MKIKLILPLAASFALGFAACGDDKDDKDNNNNTEKECTLNSDCASRSDGKTECNTTTNKCVAPEIEEPECTQHSDCAGRSDGKTECDTTTNKCVAPQVVDPECTTDEDCADNAEGKTECDTDAQKCVEPQGTPAIKISQIYFGGIPVAKGTYDGQYVELFNAGDAEADLSTYSFLFGGKEGNISSIFAFAGYCSEDKCLVPVGGYFLVKVSSVSEAAFTASETSALDADIDLDSNNSIGWQGVFAIVENNQLANGALCADTKAAAADLLGVDINSCFEGVGAPSGITTAGETANRGTKAYTRKDNGCMDTNDNAADFTVEDANPHNSKTLPVPCAAE
ncbi:MAG: hypothetical protein LBM75_01180 [Myxococcales bacterium]|jgi:hypothetical protein|nr:hypothetical protein [Myxococcales bacterium]